MAAQSQIDTFPLHSGSPANPMSDYSYPSNPRNGLVDLSLVGLGSFEADLRVAEKLIKQFDTCGYVLVGGYERWVDYTLANNVFSQSKTFFAMPNERKRQLDYDDVRSNRGYLYLGREQSYHGDADLDDPSEIDAQITDLKESFEIGNDRSEEHPEHWPDENDLPRFKPVMKQFHDGCHALNKEILRLLALGLGLEENCFTVYTKKQHNFIRLLHYPPTLAYKNLRTRMGAHTDFGTISLLWQEDVGGLQVASADEQWNDVPVIPQSIVVLIGDQLAMQTNDRLKSSLHRAVLLSDQSKQRWSVVYYCNPDPGTIIKCIDGLGPSVYDEFNTSDYYASGLSFDIE